MFTRTPLPVSAGEPARVSGRDILLIEDESDIARLVTLHLADAGARVEHVGDGRDGLELALSRAWDLVLLDLGLPRCDGLEICRRLRAARPDTPVIMLTARSGEAERVLGLEGGADDYVVKPFGVRELLARIEALFRRIERAREPDALTTIAAGDVLLDPRTHAATVAGAEVTLTAREFALLAHFARSPGEVFSRTDLLDAVWGQSYEGYLHTVNTHINRLRGKIEPEPSRPRYIETVWGVGYRLCDAPSRVDA